MSERFGRTLRSEREGAKLSLRAFAQMIGVSPAYLSKVERGIEKPPTKERVIEIAKQLDMNEDLFLMEAGHLPDYLDWIIRRQPVAMSELVRACAGLTFTQIEYLTLAAKKMKESK